MFSGGKRGHSSPILARLFLTNQKRGQGFDPPQIFGPAMETYPQRSAKHRKTPQNTAKCRKMPQNAAKCRKMPQNAAHVLGLLPICCKMLQNAGKHRKTPENARKRWKTPENAVKRRNTPQNAAKYRKLTISLRGTKYLGG